MWQRSLDADISPNKRTPTPNYVLHIIFDQFRATLKSLGLLEDQILSKSLKIFIKTLRSVNTKIPLEESRWKKKVIGKRMPEPKWIRFEDLGIPKIEQETKTDPFPFTDPTPQLISQIKREIVREGIRKKELKKQFEKKRRRWQWDPDGRRFKVNYENIICLGPS